MSKKEITTKKTPVKQVAVSSKLIVGNSFKSFENEANVQLDKCKEVTIVNDDETNKVAREVAKSANTLKTNINKARLTLNKPLQDRISANNNEAKQIIESIDGQIDRLKSLINSYEVEKQKKIEAELRKAEEERRKKEEEERKERERIAELNRRVNQMNTDYMTSINGCTSLKEIENITSEVKSISATKKEFDFLAENVKEIKANLLSLIKERKDIILKLQKVNKEDKQGLLDDLQNKGNETIQQMSIQEQQMETFAEQEIMQLLFSISSEDIEGKMEYVKNTYGSYRNAVKFRGKIIEHYKSIEDLESNVRELKDDRVKNIRRELKFKVQDIDKVPREFLKIDEAKIKEFISQNRDELRKDVNSSKIDGIEFYIETQTILR